MAEQRVRQLVPRGFGRRLVNVARRAQAAALRGDAVECPCCGGTFRRFLTYGRPSRPAARCPACGALERHRATWLYLRDWAHILDGHRRVLDVAPVPYLAGLLTAAPSIDYLSIDLESPLAMRRMDVTALDLPDAAFEVVLCSHVLEHVPDDRAAMRELRRVTAEAGLAILQTPWDPAATHTDEDPAIADEAERIRRFGQADHIRMYGRDLFDRLAAAGWSVEQVDLAAVLGSALAARYGLASDDPLLVGRPSLSG